MSGDNKVQLAEIKFQSAGKEVIPIQCENVHGGRNPKNEVPSMAIDRNTRTKWLDFERKGLILTFETPVVLSAITYTTANDYPSRDTKRFTLWGRSSKEGQWEMVKRIDEDLNPPKARFTDMEWVSIP